MSRGRLYITLTALQCMDSKELNSFSFVQHPQIQLTEPVVLTESYCSTVLTMFFSYDVVFMHVSGSVHAKKKRYYISHFYFRDNPTERLGYQKGGLKDIMKNKYGIRHCPLL